MYYKIFLKFLCIFLCIFSLFSCQKRNTFKSYSYSGNDEEIITFQRLLLNNRSDLALQYLIDKDLMDRLKSEDHLAYWLVYYWDKHIQALIDYLLDNGFILNKELPLLHLAIENINYEAFVWLYDQGFDLEKKHRYGKLFDKTSAIEYASYYELKLIDYIEDDDIESESLVELVELKKIRHFIREAVSIKIWL